MYLLVLCHVHQLYYLHSYIVTFNINNLVTQVGIMEEVVSITIIVAVFVVIVTSLGLGYCVKRNPIELLWALFNDNWAVERCMSQSAGCKPSTIL